MPELILLIGPRGCGKTTIGRRLASVTGVAFVDLDDVTLGRFDEPTVREVWATRGEPAWREAEVAATRETLAGAPQVVALGGGTPTIAAARAAIDESRRTRSVAVVYLKCAPARLEERLAASPGDRPSLTGADPAAEVAAVLAEREPVYEAVADVVYEVGREEPAATAAGVLEAIREAIRRR